MWAIPTARLALRGRIIPRLSSHRYDPVLLHLFCGHSSQLSYAFHLDLRRSCLPQHIGVVRPGKDGVVGQRPSTAGEKMDVDGPASAPAGAAAGGTVSYSIGTSALAFRKDHMEIENPIQDGIVENW